MPIAPITGQLRRRILIDIGGGLTAGLACAYGYWYGIHLPAVHKREQFYLKLEKERAIEAATAASE